MRLPYNNGNPYRVLRRSRAIYIKFPTLLQYDYPSGNNCDYNITDSQSAQQMQNSSKLILRLL